MKKLLIICIALLPLFAFSQDYKLFNANSKKAYINIPQEDSTWCIAFDSATIVGSDSVYYNYLGLNGQIVGDSSCNFWTGPMCVEQSKPSWLGFMSITNNNRKYYFITNNLDTLTFDFNLSIGDTTVFYQDSAQVLKIIYKAIIDTTILSISDSVKIFKVLHTDNSGIIINSSLQGMKIIIGKSMGLVSFFRIDKFPQVLQAVELIGNTAPEAGLSKITALTVYDHHIGDEIQFYEYYYSTQIGNPYPNPTIYEHYIKYIFLNRTDNANETVYRIKRETIDLLSQTQFIDTIDLFYLKEWEILKIPFDRITTSNTSNISLTKSDYCGFKLWSINRIPLEMVYCLKSNCWGGYETQGPPLMGHSIQVCGLGIYDKNLHRTMYYSSKEKIVYFKKDGIICGNEYYVGINDELKISNEKLQIFPNPANDNLHIKFSENKIQQKFKVIIYNSIGIKVKSIEAKNNLELDIKDLKSGIYFIQVQTESKAVYNSKFVKI